MSLWSAAAERVLRANTSELASSPLGKVAVDLAAGAVRRFTPAVDEIILRKLAEFPDVQGTVNQGAMILSQLEYFNTPNPLLGGITPRQAQIIAEDLQSRNLARKNLFLIEVSSELLGDGISQTFNLFATSVEYAPYTLTGEKRRIGSASTDSLQSSDPVEMRITTHDDTFGTLSRWFAVHAQKAASSDGTVSPPGHYAIRIKIVHAYITQDTNLGGYEDVGLFRPGNIEFSLSRAENSMKEVTMSFAQLDTFLKP